MGIGISDIAAVAALAISIWTAVKTDRFNKRQAAFESTNERLNLMLIEKEAEENKAQKRADVSANFYQSGNNNYRLKVFNKGQAPARNIMFYVMDDSDILIKNDIDRKFPVPILEQHQSVELIAAVSMGSPSRAHIKLTWDDATGNGHEKELHPSW